MKIHKLDPKKARQEAEEKKTLLRQKRRNAKKNRSPSLKNLLDAIFRRRPPN